MKFLLIIPAIFIIDFLRSVVVIAKLQHDFYKYYKPQQDLYIIGNGKEFHIVLLGDSGIDGHASNKLKFGPAQTTIEQLARTHKVVVHIFAKESSRSYDVINKQLPKVEELKNVDMIFVYMGANNVIRGKSANQVYKDFVTLVDYAEQRNTVVVATEVADYHHLTMFSWVARLIIWRLIRSCNGQLRKLAAQRDNFVLTDMTWLTKKYISQDWMADRLHPNDPMIRLWSEKAFDAVKADSATKNLFL
jgi:lysophospholipase L1-like esterase